MWRTDQGHVLRHCYPGPFPFLRVLRVSLKQPFWNILQEKLDISVNENETTTK